MIRPLPKILPTAIKIPSSPPAAIIAARTSAAPLQNAMTVTLI